MVKAVKNSVTTKKPELQEAFSACKMRCVFTGRANTAKNAITVVGSWGFSTPPGLPIWA